MRRWVALTYGVVVYALFLVTTLYATGFFANFLVPKGIDSGTAGPVGASVVIDLALLGVFAAQHTIMARSWFKARWTQIVPAPVERSTYVLFASLALLLLYWQWRPLPAWVWHITHPLGRIALWGVYGLGWLLVLLSTFAVSHADLFGLRQVWLNLQSKAYTFPPFKVTGFYRVVRHPLLLGFLIAFWATPDLTVGHALFAAASTGYILVGIQLEERDLLRFIGVAYQKYRQQTPMLIPWPVRRKAWASSVGGDRGLR